MATPWYDYTITHGYITAYQGPGTDTPHFAVDLGTPFHTPLTALKSGTVVTADYQPWGGEIFIKPDDGSTEYYYYHPDLVEVQTGQHVTAGQEIALSGGENPGYPGALHPAQPQWSTGPHTHVGYFTNWYTGQSSLGTVPQGPDITSTLQQLQTTGQITGPVPTNTSTGGITTPVQSTTGSTVTANDISQVPQAIASGLTRTGLFVIALVVIAGGFYIAFNKQINQAVKTGSEVAVKAALA